MRFRPADAGDRSLLVRATLENLNWMGPRFAPDDVTRDPQFARYLTSFDAAGDFGIVAVVPGQVAGVCWAVSLTAADPGYGYVSDDIPEVSITVFEAFRRRGIARALLNRVMEEAARRGVPALSLSVEDGNPSKGLYESLGFRFVHRNGGSDTMRVDLG